MIAPPTVTLQLPPVSPVSVNVAVNDPPMVNAAEAASKLPSEPVAVTA